MCIDNIAADAAHFLAISVTTITFSISAPPEPLYSTGVPIPLNPILAILLKSSLGKIPVLSVSAAIGAISFSANSFATL